MLLLLLQMNDIKASQASCCRILIPVNFGAFFLKFGSWFDHFLYSKVRFGVKLK